MKKEEKEELEKILKETEERRKELEIKKRDLDLERERLAARLREYRKLMNLSQKELADKLGKAQTVISSWEIGTGVPDANQLPQIARALDVSLEDLCGIPEVKSSDQILLDAYHNANEVTRENVRLLLGIKEEG